MLIGVYSKVVKSRLHSILDIKVAEAAKVIENTQRDINIALINDLALISHKLGIDATDVIDAAATKWNFANYSPGLVGGHCIGVNPYYLAYKSLQVGYSPQLMLSGRNINESMGHYIVQFVIKELVKKQKISSETVATALGFFLKKMFRISGIIE